MIHDRVLNQTILTAGSHKHCHANSLMVTSRRKSPTIQHQIFHAWAVPGKQCLVWKGQRVQLSAQFWSTGRGKKVTMSRTEFLFSIMTVTITTKMPSKIFPPLKIVFHVMICAGKLSCITTLTPQSFPYWYFCLSSHCLLFGFTNGLLTFSSICGLLFLPSDFWAGRIHFGLPEIKSCSGLSACF